MSDRQIQGAMMKAMWSDDACAYKKNADQIDPEKRVELLTAAFGMMAPPGYSMDSSIQSGLTNSSKDVQHFAISNSGALFYELNVKRGADGKMQVVDEKPTNCR